LAIPRYATIGGGSPELVVATTQAALWPWLFQALRYSSVTDSDKSVLGSVVQIGIIGQ